MAAFSRPPPCKWKGLDETKEEEPDERGGKKKKKIKKKKKKEMIDEGDG